MDKNQESQPYLDKSSPQDCLHKAGSMWAATPAPAPLRATVERIVSSYVESPMLVDELCHALAATPAPAPTKPFPGRIVGGATLDDSLRAKEAQEIASKFDTRAALEKARKDRAATPAPAPDAPLRDAQEQPFEDWWEREGQFCRAGGGAYEKTFAWNAWCAALAATSAPAPQWTPEAVARTLALAEELRNKIKAKPEDEAGQGKEASNG